MPLNDAIVAQSALVLNGFVDQVADAQMERRGAWYVQRVQTIYDALVNSGSDDAMSGPPSPVTPYPWMIPPWPLFLGPSKRQRR
ncbi:MAG: hypothetical protein O3A42_00710 [Actinobacteria bacterium]|nr:hypothetical protein [Actinomycetota bacterium]